MTQQHRIRIDLCNTVVGLKIDANAWSHVVYPMFPGNMNPVMPCSRGTWRCTDETGPHCLFLHITWRASDQSRSLNSDLEAYFLSNWYRKASPNKTFHFIYSFHLLEDRTVQQRCTHARTAAIVNSIKHSTRHRLTLSRCVYIQIKIYMYTETRSGRHRVRISSD